MITKKFQHTTYSILLEITTSGIIDKTDVIGSLYNQMRDVLKQEVSFEDLVKSGKLGNIEVSISKLKTRTKAKCSIPTNLDFKQTCLLAAKCEQITKIGHVQGIVKVLSIEHSQKDIEEKILKRAEELEKKFSVDINKNNTVNLKPKIVSEIVELSSNVYSTKSIKKYKTIYLVEGRSDVRTLVKYNIHNVISVNGSFLDILKLKNEKWFSSKELILLFDGDSSAQKLSEQIKQHLTISKELFAPKGIEISKLSKYKLNKLLEIENNNESNFENIKNDIDEGVSNTEIIADEKNYFSKNEYFILENYLQAIKDKGRIVGFDFTFGVVFDEPISKLSSLDFSLIDYVLYDGLCENIFYKKIKDSPIKCIIAKGFSKTVENIESITFKEFEQSIIE